MFKLVSQVQLINEPLRWCQPGGTSDFNDEGIQPMVPIAEDKDSQNMFAKFSTKKSLVGCLEFVSAKLHLNFPDQALSAPDLQCSYQCETG